MTERQDPVRLDVVTVEHSDPPRRAVCLSIYGPAVVRDPDMTRAFLVAQGVPAARAEDVITLARELCSPSTT